MLAAVINNFNNEDSFQLKKIPIPIINSNEVLIRVKYSAISPWDLFEREGGYAQMLGLDAKFPYILGSEGSGEIVAKGEDVKKFLIGDRVYAPAFLNPKGGFYAEFVAVNQGFISLIPENLTSQQAAVVSGIGITALRGLVDFLNLKKGELLAIFGASGGIGHVAVQIAKKLGAKVFAVASCEDGVSLVKELGIANVVDGRKDDVLACAVSMGFNRFDAVLLTYSNEVTEKFISKFCSGGKVVYPNGVYPEPKERDDVKINGFNGEPDSDIVKRLALIIESYGIVPYIEKVYNLNEVDTAYSRLREKHYLGKLGLKI
jgi:NADPH:quinone reductase-like Zn-dependent oxidoreductase